MTILGLDFAKLLPIVLLAVVVLGPQKLPIYAAKLRDGIRTVRNYANGAKSRMREEMGSEFDDIDWKKLDPRQYDPRRIVRDALADEPTAPVAAAATQVQTKPASIRSAVPREDVPAPFDDEAT